MLAWMLSRNQDRFNQWGSLFKAVAIVSLPAALVLLQPDAGTVLVFTGLILVFYREGLSGNVLIAVLCALLVTIATILSGASTVHYPGAGEATGAWILWGILLSLGAFLWATVPQWTVPPEKTQPTGGVVQLCRRPRSVRWIAVRVGGGAPAPPERPNPRVVRH